MFKIITLLSFIFLLPVNAKSTEIAAIEHDGRYMVFDLDTFEISNVGDLSRFGFVYINCAISGSTYNSAVIVAEFPRKPTESNKAPTQFTLNKLTKLNHDRSYIPKGHSINYDEQYVSWVANDPQKRIVLISREDKKTMTISDENLQHIEQHQLNSNFELYNATACTDKDENIIIAGWDESIRIKKNNKKDISIIKKRLADQKHKTFGVVDTSDGCHAFMTSLVSKDQPKFMARRIINIDTNISQKPFITHRYGEYAIIDDGQLLVQQRLNAIPIPNTPGVKTTGSENFILYNTQTGEKIKEFKIPNQNATLRKVVKTDKGYIAILGGPKNIQFVSLETYKSLKTIKLPFKRFFVI